MHRRFIMPLTVALALAGCDGSPDVDGPDGSTPGLDAGPPTGEASLSFTPTWGDAQRQFQGQVWQAILDLNVFQPTTADARDTRLVIMLCAPSDATCQSPVLVREIASDETDGDPIQDNFGPDIVATNLPAGSSPPAAKRSAPPTPAHSRPATTPASASSPSTTTKASARPATPSRSRSRPDLTAAALGACLT